MGGCLLALYGPVKAQAPMGQLLQRPWKLPFRSNSEPLKFVVLQSGGEARLQMQPQQHRYHVQFPASRDIMPSLATEIGLHLRRLGNGALRSDTTPPQLSTEKQEHAVSTATVGAHVYLETHKLVTLTKDLLRDLVTDRPQDPYRFLLERLERKAQELPLSSKVGPSSDPKDSSVLRPQQPLEQKALQTQLSEMKDAINSIAAKNLADLDGGSFSCRRPGAEADEVSHEVAVAAPGRDCPGLEPAREYKSGRNSA